MISGSNQELQQELEYTILSQELEYTLLSQELEYTLLSQLVNFKMQSGREDTLEERNAIKFCFKLGKIPQKRMEFLRLLFDQSCMNQESVFEWHKRFKKAGESVRDDEKFGRRKEVNRPEMIGQSVRVRVTMLRF